MSTHTKPRRHEDMKKKKTTMIFPFVISCLRANQDIQEA
jgi:hypothetical protein